MSWPAAMAGAQGCTISIVDGPWSCAITGATAPAHQTSNTSAKRFITGGQLSAVSWHHWAAEEPRARHGVCALFGLSNSCNTQGRSRGRLGAKRPPAHCPSLLPSGLLQGWPFAARDGLALLTHVAPQRAGILQANGVGGIIIEFDEHQPRMGGMTNLAALGHFGEGGVLGLRLALR